MLNANPRIKKQPATKTPLKAPPRLRGWCASWPKAPPSKARPTSTVKANGEGNPTIANSTELLKCGCSDRYPKSRPLDSNLLKPFITEALDHRILRQPVPL